MTTPTTEADLANYRKQLGAVYTPKWLAQWLAREVAQRFGYTPNIVLDPAAGEGALLDAAHEFWPKAARIAIDLDRSALETIDPTINLKVELDAVLSPWPLEHCNNRLVLANPPWGATMTQEYRKQLEQVFETARGQFDTYDVFIERITTELSTGDMAAIFLPESFFQKQHTLTRKFIANNCTLGGVYRLGEGVFPNVNMAAIALIFSKGTARNDHKVKIGKLRAQARSHITNATDLYSNLSESLQEVPQEELVGSHQGTWGFDTKYNGLAKDIRTSTGTDAWNKWFKTGRGLEIGKNGHLLICPTCLSVRSYPKAPSPFECRHCGTPLSPHDNSLELVSSATERPGNQWVRLAVGQDLHRHSLLPTRWVKLNVEGIDYKNETTQSRKQRLLVRKTGLGIHAAVEWEPTATTQTIYHFSPADTAPDFAVAYAAGMLSSRILTAWHIAASGDGEWRSHPYLTLSSIQSLPLPEPIPGSEQYDVALMIANNVRKSRTHSRHDQAIDLHNEYLVAKMLGNGPELVEWALEVLSKATGSTYLTNLADVPKDLHKSTWGVGK